MKWYKEFICKICNETMSGGNNCPLKNHLKQVHNLSLRDYVILTEHGGVSPKCKCGYEKPRDIHSAMNMLVLGKFKPQSVTEHNSTTMEEEATTDSLGNQQVFSDEFGSLSL